MAPSGPNPRTLNTSSVKSSCRLARFHPSYATRVILANQRARPSYSITALIMEVRIIYKQSSNSSHHLISLYRITSELVGPRLITALCQSLKNWARCSMWTRVTCRMESKVRHFKSLSLKLVKVRQQWSQDTLTRRKPLSIGFYSISVRRSSCRGTKSKLATIHRSSSSYQSSMCKMSLSTVHIRTLSLCSPP